MGLGLGRRTEQKGNQSRGIWNSLRGPARDADETEHEHVTEHVSCQAAGQGFSPHSLTGLGSQAAGTPPETAFVLFIWASGPLVPSCPLNRPQLGTGRRLQALSDSLWQTYCQGHPCSKGRLTAGLTGGPVEPAVRLLPSGPTERKHSLSPVL